MTQTKNKNYQSLETGWIDISVPLSNGMAYWPTDPEVQIKRIHDMKDGDQDNPQCALTQELIWTHHATSGNQQRL